MATSLLYLGLCLGFCSILVIASSGGVCVYSCCSCCGCCGVVGVAIEVASGTVIRTTCSAAVGIAGGIGGCSCGYRCGCCCGCFCCGGCFGAYCWWVRMLFIDLACCAGCLGVVGVRGGVLVLKWDGACVDRACTDGACSCPLLEFP